MTDENKSVLINHAVLTLWKERLEFYLEAERAAWREVVLVRKKLWAMESLMTELGIGELIVVGVDTTAKVEESTA